METYLAELCRPESDDLRTKLRTKMDHICNVRTTRGVMELLDTAPGDPKA